jgi:hypothetical protein
MTRGLGALGAWMILRLWFVLVLVLADAVFRRDVAAQPAPQIPSGHASPAEITPPAPDGLAFLKTPIVFYLAKGEADACGPGCNEWIAAEGSFDPGAMARFRAFLAETRATKLPIYIHSPGGLAGFAYQIGRLIRRQGMTVGVSRTMPEECKGQDEKSCNALKRSGKMLTAELSPFAVCASACVPVLAAGNIRQVPPGARVGVHSAKAVRLYADGRVTIPAKSDPRRLSALDTQQRKYLNEMGIDSRLVDIASKIPNESVYYLTRDEIANLGIDKREFMETRWMVSNQKTVSVRKWFVETKGPNHNELRLGVLSFSCTAGARSRAVAVSDIRSLASDEGSVRQKRWLEAASRRIALGGPLRQMQVDELDTGRSIDYWVGIESLDHLDQVAAQGKLNIGSAALPETADTARQIISLSTAGLSQAISALHEKCGGESVYSGATAPKPENKP